MVKYNSYIQMNSLSKLMSDRGINDNGRVQKFIDKEAIRLMSPYTPKETTALITSATRLTKIGSGLIRQGGASAPYGRRWYYEKANFKGAPMRGNYWFKRTMQNGGAKIILQGAKKEAGL